MPGVDALLEELAVSSGGEDPELAVAQLEKLLDLPSVNLKIRRARVVGHGGRASADLYLSDSSVITFESLRDMASPTKLAVEIAACTGATPKLKAPQAVQVVSLVRAIAERTETVSEDEAAISWGVEYLQASGVVDVDFNDQAQRWRAFEHLNALDPYRQTGAAIARASAALRDPLGERYVRTGWFRAFVRAEDQTISPREISHRMERVGWRKPSRSGRIKATRPQFSDKLNWSFYVVPAGWESDK